MKTNRWLMATKRALVILKGLFLFSMVFQNVAFAQFPVAELRRIGIQPIERSAFIGSAGQHCGEHRRRIAVGRDMGKDGMTVLR